MTKNTKFIAYFRVSTQKQGRSGLGLDAQERAVQAHVGTEGTILASYTEIETAKRDNLENRPQLRAAIAHAKRSKSTLLIAKLDRLSRSVAVTSALHQSNVDFVACDMANANRSMIQFMAVVAEMEAKAISDRTKEALASYVARGSVNKLGVVSILGKAGPTNLSEASRAKGRIKGAHINHAKAISEYEDLQPSMKEWRSDGWTLTRIATHLNDDGQTTRKGKSWSAMQVKRVLELV